MNKYGRFQYYDYPIGAEINAQYSATPIQDGANPDSIKSGYVPEDFQSFELGEYNTEHPKKLYDGSSLSFTSANVSDENGNFTDFPTLTISFNSFYITLTALKILSRNIIKNGEIIAYRDSTEIGRNAFSNTETEQLIDIVADNVNKIEIVIKQIDKPLHFAGIYKVAYGKTVIFGDEAIIDNEVTLQFSLKGDNLPFDVLDMNLYSKVQNPNFIQRKQRLAYETQNGTLIQNFYIEQGVSKENNTINMTAYDEVSNLNSKFYGGLWLGEPNDMTSVKELIPNILNNTGIDFSFGFPLGADKDLIGYLPIDTRGKILQKVMLSSGFRCFKGAKLNIGILKTEPIGELNETNILVEPKLTIDTKLPLRQLRLNVSRYSKGTEETEFYHWYVDSQNPVTFEFDQPLYNLRAYNSYMENGKEVVSDVPSTFVEFVEIHPNYCVVRNSYQGKLVFKGNSYVKSISTFTKTNPTISATELYDEVVVNLDLAPKSDADCQELCNKLFEIYEKTETLKFMTTENVKVGYVYSIKFDNRPPKNYTIIKKVDKLNGVYEVEAV